MKFKSMGIWCICIYIYVYACIRVYVYMYIGICVCIYTSPYSFLRRVGMHSQVWLSTTQVQVCMLDRWCEHQRTHLLHARYRMCICAIYILVYTHICKYIFLCMHVYICICMYVYTCTCVHVWMYINVYVYVYMYVYIYICICMCIYIYISLYIACMCSFFHLAFGNEDACVQLVYESACCWAWGVIFDRRKDRGVVCVCSIFNAGGRSVCVYAHTHTQYTDGVLGYEPRSRDEIPGGPEKSWWTKSRHTCIRICVQKTTCVYIC